MDSFGNGFAKRSGVLATGSGRTVLEQYTSQHAKPFDKQRDKDCVVRAIGKKPGKTSPDSDA
jgi:hypothetical protein